jgi:hypothetical protein
MTASPSTVAPRIAPKSTLIVAKFKGRCSCGQRFPVGASVAWSGAYDHPITGCAACGYGTFPGATAESLLEHSRACMALADNGIRIQARDGSVGRMLTQVDLAAAARAALLARSAA